MLISMLSMLIESLEMSGAEVAVALAPLARDLKPKDLLSLFPSDVCLQEVKFVLNKLLPLCHFLGSLARLRLSPSPFVCWKYMSTV